MTRSFEEQIHELMKSGRLSRSIAEALTEYYSRQRDPLKGEAAGLPSKVNLVELMDLIDLLEKKKELPKVPGTSQELPAQKVYSLGSPMQFLHENKDEYLVSSVSDKSELERKRLEARIEELGGKCERLEAELAAEKKAHVEAFKMKFASEGGHDVSREERKGAHAAEENKRKALEKENSLLLDVIKRVRGDEEKAGERVAELEAEVRTAHAQMKSLEEKTLALEKAPAQFERDLGEKEAKLREEIRELEAKRAVQESEVRAKEAITAGLIEKHRAVVETHEKERLSLEGEKNRLERERTAAIKAGEEKALALEKAQERFTQDLGAKDAAVENLRTRILEVEAAAEKSQSVLRALEEDKKRLSDEREVFEKELARSGKDLAAKGKESEVLKSQLHELEESSAKSRTVLTAMEEDKKRLEDEKAQLSEDIEVRTAEEAKLREEIRELEAKRAAQESEVKAKEAITSGLIEKHRAVVETHEKERLALEEEKRRLKGERESLILELTEKRMKRLS